MEKTSERKGEREERRQHKLVGRLLVLFMLAGGCIVFEILTFRGIREGFLANNAPLFIILACGFTFFGVGIGVLFLLKKREASYKTFLTIYITLFFFLVLAYVVVKTDFIVILQSPELYQRFLEDTGAWMPFLYILLQFLQVVLLPIPSLVSTLAGIALFGALQTAVYSLIGILAGSFLGFFVGRKLGFKAVSWLVGEDKLRAWLKKMKGKDNLILTTMFVLPLFPDDILCFVAGLSTMSVKYFTLMILFARSISVFTTCFSVDLIPLNTWWGIALWGLIFAVGIVGFIYLYKNINKINGWLKRRKRGKTQKKTAR